MTAEDLARKARRDAPWDDLRERRVLARVLAEQKRPSKAPRYAMGAVAAIVAAAAIVFLVVRMRAPEKEIATAPAEQTMVLADGSQAVMLRDAGVQIEEQSKDRVRIAQARGAVRYEVRPDPAREFTVRAAGTTVRVRGTVFVVDVAGDSVEVRVDRGRVEVDDGTRTRDLVAGEVLRVPARAAVAAPPPDPEPNDSASPSSARPPPSAPPAPATAGELQAKADAARLAGNLGDAASALETLIARYPRDGRVPAALFSLGRVERARGRHTASAQAFERCARSGGALAQDALAEAAASWSAAGAADAARANATAYLTRYPNGPHAARMKAIAGP